MKHSKNHLLIMILGCAIPLLFIFIAQVFGINESLSLFIFIVIMLGFHLLFPMHLGLNHGHDNHSDSNSTENNN